MKKLIPSNLAKMPPITRKRSAPQPPVDEETSSEDEHSVINEPDLFSSYKTKYKCPIKGCKKPISSSNELRIHYRISHTKNKPYKCTFPSCDHACAALGDLYKHIRKIHKQQSTKMAKDYVQVLTEILADEAKELGIKEYFTGEINSEGKFEDDGTTVIIPYLPHFTTIHQASTGYLICPLSDCDHQAKGMVNLKKHYRVHCGSEYRPYRCIFPDVIKTCRYAATEKKNVERHIRVKHFYLPASIKKLNETVKDDDDRNESDFVETRTDWLEMENDLFNSAEIVSSPEVQKPRLFACTFSNCAKSFNQFTTLRNHLRTHLKSKPFKCLFPNCTHSSTQKEDIFRHINFVHFKVPRNKQGNLSKEEKQRAEHYVEVNQELLDEEEAQVESVRIGPKQSQRKRNCQQANTVSADDSLNCCEVQIGYTGVEKDDKEELFALLAALEPTISN